MTRRWHISAWMSVWTGGRREGRCIDIVSDRGGKYGFVFRSRQKAYRALRKHGMPKSMAAAISNGGRTHVQRVSMARKAAATRRARGRK